MDNHQALVKQILFYLSDENLSKDEFFYNKVAADPDHFVELKCFLDCNKVKKLGYTKLNSLREAIQKSKQLELNAEKDKLRKKGMQAIPEFTGKKKSKTDKDGNEQVNPYVKMETVIFSLSLPQEKTVPFKYIQESLLKNHNTYSPYVRFNKNQGNFAVQKKNCSPQLIAQLEKDGLKVGETTLTVTKAEGDKLNEFWEKHGHHYNGIIDNLRKDFDKKLKNEKKAHNLPKKVSVFEFGGQKYEDINKLKSLFKNILARNGNNIPLKEKDTNLIKELLSYHDRGEEKLKGFTNFVVDVNPTYADTRCFFIVRDDGTREDFSVVKCIKNIEDKFSA